MIDFFFNVVRSCWVCLFVLWFLMYLELLVLLLLLFMWRKFLVILGFFLGVFLGVELGVKKVLVLCLGLLFVEVEIFELEVLLFMYFCLKFFIELDLLVEDDDEDENINCIGEFWVDIFWFEVFLFDVFFSVYGGRI